MEDGNCYNQAQRPRSYDCLLFDLDDTLYPLSSGLAMACRKNIGDYMVEKLGIDESKIPDMCNLLYKKYGTTMAGLRAIGYEFNYDDYHRFVHGRLPYENLKPDPVLRSLLLSLPLLRKVIFTNADEKHANEVLRKLGLEDCFQGIICFETLNPNENSSNDVKSTESETDGSGPSLATSPFDVLDHFSLPNADEDLPKTPIICKPSVCAIEQALRIAEINPQRTIFFEDSIRNIQAGKQVGLRTVLVGTSQRSKGADFALESIHNIKEALPELWEDAHRPEGIKNSGTFAMETSVVA